MFKTNKKGLWEVSIGVVEKDGTLIDNYAAKNVVASSAEEAISKARLKKDEYLFGVKLLQDIDVA